MKLGTKITIGIVGGIGAALVGFIGGALSRQPEVNELQAQVQSLQGEVSRLQGVIKVQYHQINQLKYRYVTLKGADIIQRNKQRGYIKGAIMFQYALKEYLNMLIMADRTGRLNLNESQIEFYNAFGQMMNTGKISSEGRTVVMNYIRSKYQPQIDNYQESDFTFEENYFAGGQTYERAF